jgi:Na+-transporting methylmalonyl-CoA/oxaloacetate decarboxylase gamma subunit
MELVFLVLELQILTLRSPSQLVSRDLLPEHASRKHESSERKSSSKLIVHTL